MTLAPAHRGDFSRKFSLISHPWVIASRGHDRRRSGRATAPDGRCGAATRDHRSRITPGAADKDDAPARNSVDFDFADAVKCLKAPLATSRGTAMAKKKATKKKGTKKKATKKKAKKK
ncbi:MAG: hypothetical protein IT442_17725, partial [Phycisphaeraceae bacterium]|nr:hypothetical protein [Phycisphaeraceae bacterium]